MSTLMYLFLKAISEVRLDEKRSKNNVCSLMFLLLYLCFYLVVGGLLSAHLLSQQAKLEVESNWPCDGPLLRLAVDLATRLLPGTKIYYLSFNLKFCNFF